MELTLISDVTVKNVKQHETKKNFYIVFFFNFTDH
jgi:hypothetical protein